MTMEAITSAISQNYIDLVEFILTSEEPGSSSDTLVFVLRRGLKDIRERKEGNSDPQVIAAVENSIKTIVKFLVGRGADVNLIITKTFPDDESIFSHICRYASTEFIKMVMELVDLNVEDKNNRIPIQIAMSTGREVVIDLFLERIEVDDINRLDLLHHYVESNVACREIIAKFLGLGANVNSESKFVGSVVGCAARGGSLEAVKLLLENGVDVNGGGNFDDPPIWHAAGMGHEEIVQLLLDQGAYQYDDALVTAAVRQKVNVVKKLLHHGYNANCGDSNGSVLYQAALVCGNEDIIRLLLDHGADIDKRMSDGTIALHAAACEGNVGNVQVLLDYEANINVKDYRGMTPLMVSIQSEHDDQSKLFVRRVILMKSQNLPVSEENLSAIGKNNSLLEYKKTCESEMELLQTKQFDDTNFSYFDVFKIKDVYKLASFARNENIVNVLTSEEFKETFPIYGEMIVGHFNKGALKNKDFELLKRFINYLSSRDHDELPKLPLTVIHELYDCLGDEGIVNLKKL